MADTKIEWAEKVWNPVVGCTIHSPGCKNCYAMRMAARLEAMSIKPDGSGNVALMHYEGTTESSRRGAVWTGKIGIAPDEAFTAPLRRKKPTDYFVNSMSDLFHKDVPDHVIDRVFAAMALCPQHTFKVLTKRSDRMRAYMAERLGADWSDYILPHVLAFMEQGFGGPDHGISWPLPNVWLGVSVEDQTRANERIPDLLDTPAAVRFLSCEPLLGPVELGALPWPGKVCDCEDHGPTFDALNGSIYCEGCCEGPESVSSQIDWIIAGGESGPGARPMYPDWARSLRDQCNAAGVPLHFKQWGEWAPSENCTIDCTAEALIYDATAKEWRKSIDGGWIGDQAMCRVGKKRAGRLLDGVEHNGFPGAV